MKITAANTGDLLCLYQTGKRIRILEVSDDYVSYQQEDGQRYATKERQADAFIERDPERISAFNENCRLGQALHAAELGALKALLSNPLISQSEREDADRVLAVAREQQAHMSARLVQERQSERPGQALARAFLDQLYEMGTGSHDTFFGCKVENLSQFQGNFRINGQAYDYDTALQHLSHGTQEHTHGAVNAPASVKSSSLADLIKDADKRKVAATPERPSRSFDREMMG